MMNGKTAEPRLRTTRRLLNVLTVAIYVLAATQAFRSVLADAASPLTQITASLTMR
jgi:hypothetical protein